MSITTTRTRKKNGGSIRLLWTLGREYLALRRFTRSSPDRRARLAHLPVRFIETLLGLGPTFVKLGQILSTRSDLLPAEYIAALAVLQENLPPIPFVDIRGVVEQELNQRLDQAFVAFAERPIACASLAQVHRARLPDGHEVAVKVQKPGTADQIEADLNRLAGLLVIAKRLFPKSMRRSNLAGWFMEFSRYTRQELDFLQEGQTSQRFARNLADLDYVHLPHVHMHLSTGRLLTMEFVSGLRLSEVLATFPPEEKTKLNHRLLTMLMRMFVSDGFFHADLHPGNILFTASGGIILLDSGMFGELSERERDHFVLYQMAVTRREPQRAFHHFVKQTTELPGADRAAFWEEFRVNAEEFYSSNMAELTVTQVYLRLIAAGYRHGYVFPANLVLHAKAITTAESLCFHLEPKAKFEQISKPIMAAEAARRMLDPVRLLQRLEGILPELLLTGELGPADSDLGTNVAEEQRHRSGPDSQFWGTMVETGIALLRAAEQGGGLFRMIFSEPARRVLQQQTDREKTSAILDDMWGRYRRLEPDIPIQETFGARLTVHLAGMTVAFHEALLDAGMSKKDSYDAIYKVGWLIYTWMGELPLAVAGAFTDDPFKKMKIATESFRSFPFGAPSYQWEDVPSDSDVVAFNCRKCPVAEYFLSRGLGELGFQTWCKLDFPLAEKWGGQLELSGTIAAGAQFCDFRWKLP